jgi:hypothetical protein
MMVMIPNYDSLYSGLLAGLSFDHQATSTEGITIGYWSASKSKIVSSS